MKFGVWLALTVYRYFTSFLLWITGPIFRWLFENKKSRILPVTNPLLMKSACQLADMIRNKRVKSKEVVMAYINRIKDVNGSLNALVVNCFESALKEAEKVDELLSGSAANDPRYSKENMPLLGVPFTAKEAFGIKGMPNTSGLTTCKNRVAERDADVVANLRKAGAIPLGLTNCSELCMWYESSNLLYGRTNNAYHQGRMVGGSSGGEACLQTVAGSPFGVGSDIGGSIRMPAFFNGIFGHKPTTGIVSNLYQFPEPPHGSDGQKLLSTGPLCRFADDLMPTFKAMAGPEDVAKLKLDQKVDFKKLKIYYMLDDGGSLITRPVQGQLKEVILKVSKHFEAMGASVKQVSFSKMKMSTFMWAAKMSTAGGPDFCTLMGGTSGKAIRPLKELLHWLIQSPRHTLPAIGLGLVEKLTDDPKVNDRLCQMCDRFRDEVMQMLGDDGLLLFPSHPVTAPYHHQPLLMIANFSYTAIYNTFGFPITQCPMGLGKEGLPLGLQVIASPYNDHLTLAAAKEIESTFHGWVPPCEVKV